MTAPKVVGGQHVVYPRGPERTDDHTALIAWEAELDVERAPIPTCTCFTADCEFVPGCGLHATEATA